MSFCLERWPDARCYYGRYQKCHIHMSEYVQLHCVRKVRIPTIQDLPSLRIYQGSHNMDDARDRNYTGQNHKPTSSVKSIRGRPIMKPSTTGARRRRTKTAGEVDLDWPIVNQPATNESASHRGAYLRQTNLPFQALHCLKICKTLIVLIGPSICLAKASQAPGTSFS